jgi:uncharacterized protein (DUF927 family)/phage/plasmid primase-like uncharacterized protein
MSDPMQQFRDALAGRNIVPPTELLADGNLHRCDAEGRGGKGDAAYLLHMDGIPTGGFKNWRDGQDWQNWRADVGRPLTSAEEAAHQAKIEAVRQVRDAEDAKRKADARERAGLLWADASPCTEHAYLTRKGIAAYGARRHRDSLVLPICDIAETLHSLQFIGIDGSKRYLAGGRIRGCYFSLGKPDGVLCIAEGFATGASIHLATGYAVAVAFDAGNLLAVAKALREKFPTLPLIVCADDDYRTAGNPGLTKAKEAAQAVGGLLAVPDFGADRPEGATDFNDLHQAQGLEAVAHCIDAVLNGPASAQEAAQGDETAATTPSPAGSGNNPTGGDSKTFDYGGGRFEVSPRGVFFIGTDKEDNEAPPRWICSPLHVVAMTRDAKSGEWGRLLEWHDADEVRHRWAMPLELLQGDGADMRRELARLGLSIAPGQAARNQLACYLQVWPVQARARCVERLGWHGAVYVTPAESIGQDGEIVVFQNAHALEPAFAASGTVEDWRDSVAALAQGNSRLVFALSVAFAGALADVASEDSGGFHFRGATSSGKSTTLKAAASVWGDPATYPQLWRATANGLEGLAALHNDGLLILDELSQIDPREAGEAAYLLANGQGKTRASRTGAARQSARWRLLFLSAGEESLTALMARAGKKPNAGQEIRLADIEANAGAGIGVFEALHDQPSPVALALAVKDAATKHHGAVGVAWLRAIVAERPKLADLIADGIGQFVEEYVPKGASGQVIRVARRFALVAVAGELATHYGLTGWPEGEAINAAHTCFAAWLESFGGTGNREERAILAQVRAFFEAHGASRFEDISATIDQRIPNRAGFYRTDASGTREFMVLPEAFKRDVCQGFDAKTVTATLLKAGWLAPGKDGKTTQKPRLPGMGTPRCYVFTARMWEDE